MGFTFSFILILCLAIVSSYPLDVSSYPLDICSNCDYAYMPTIVCENFDDENRYTLSCQDRIIGWLIKHIVLTSTYPTVIIKVDMTNLTAVDSITTTSLLVSCDNIKHQVKEISLNGEACSPTRTVTTTTTTVSRKTHVVTKSTTAKTTTAATESTPQTTFVTKLVELNKGVIALASTVLVVILTVLGIVLFRCRRLLRQWNRLRQKMSNITEMLFIQPQTHPEDISGMPFEHSTFIGENPDSTPDAAPESTPTYQHCGHVVTI